MIWTVKYTGKAFKQREKLPVRTKTRRTKKSVSSENSEKLSWREVANRDIRKHSEGGQMLRASRFKKDLSQKDLAVGVGVIQHHISEMENGRRPIGKELARRFAEFFEVDYRLFL